MSYTLADLQGLADGSQVAVEYPGAGAETWEKAAGGLRRNGALVPFATFDGVIKAGLISDGTKVPPTVGKWYVRDAWTFFILDVTDTHITYALWSGGRLNRFTRTVTRDSWTVTQHRLVDQSEVVFQDPYQTIRQLVTELHARSKSLADMTKESNTWNTALAQRPFLERAAARLEDSDLDRFLNRVGWARAHTTRVTLAINGFVLAQHAEMKQVLPTVTGVRWGDTNVPFAITAEVTLPVEANGCACGRNSEPLLEAAGPLLPEGYLPGNLVVAGVCQNH